MFKAAAAQVAALLYLLTVTDSFPQSYPNGAIRIVVPFAARGSADTHACYVGKHSRTNDRFTAILRGQ